MDPIYFDWTVDQLGYAIARVKAAECTYFGVPASAIGLDDYDVICANGGPVRLYRSLDNEGLWRRFAATCQSAEGALAFVNEFGLLSPASWHSVDGRQGQPVNEFLVTARRLSDVAERLDAGDRKSAAIALHKGDGPLPHGWPALIEAILPTENGMFEQRLIPLSLRDALLHQAAEAIVGNRRFRRCRNEGCSNWFRLGPHKAKDGGKTYTERREFCSDRCRVATARRQKKGALANA